MEILLWAPTSLMMMANILLRPRASVCLMLMMITRLSITERIWGKILTSTFPMRRIVTLFCTCIRIERVRKLFMISLILNELSCSKVQILCLYSQQKAISVLNAVHCVFPRNLAKNFILCSRLCGNILLHKNASCNGLLQK